MGCQPGYCRWPLQSSSLDCASMLILCWLVNPNKKLVRVDNFWENFAICKVFHFWHKLLTTKVPFQCNKIYFHLINKYTFKSKASQLRKLPANKTNTMLKV